MNIVYAAEKPSIAGVLSEYLRRHVGAQEIEVRHNPDEHGSFLIRWRLHRFVMSASGKVAEERN